MGFVDLLNPFLKSCVRFSLETFPGNGLTKVCVWTLCKAQRERSERSQRHDSRLVAMKCFKSSVLSGAQHMLLACMKLEDVQNVYED